MMIYLSPKANTASSGSFEEPTRRPSSPIAEKTALVAPVIFQAAPRPKEAWSWGHYVITAVAVILFPITILCLLVQRICSFIALSQGIGTSQEIDDGKRRFLKALGGEIVEFRTEDNVRLEGMHFTSTTPSTNPKTILICAGSHESYEVRTSSMVESFLKLGHHVMVFNYRGFGTSEGAPSEEGLYLDAEAAFQYLQNIKETPASQIVAYGYSLGAGVATDLAVQHPEINLILDRYSSSVADTAGDAGAEMAGAFGRSIARTIFHLGGVKFDINEKIKSVRGKMLLVNATRDETMLPYHRDRLERSLRDRSEGSVTFLPVNSNHAHESPAELWFHTSNIANVLARAPLAAFLATCSS